MDREKFRLFIHEVLANLYDPAVLEKYAAGDFLPILWQSSTHADDLRQFISDGIKTLRPEGKNENLESLGWRYYLILSDRYREGKSLPEIQKRLALGERQLRRLHGRALELLEAILWNQLFPREAVASQWQDQGQDGFEPSEPNFLVHFEPLALDRIVQEVLDLFLPRIQLRGGDVQVQFAPLLPVVQADRVILRQILLDVLNRAFQIWDHGNILLAAKDGQNAVDLHIQVYAAALDVASEREQISQGLIAYWIERINAKLAFDFAERVDQQQGSAFCFSYLLSLPKVNPATIFVVDDHEPAIRLIQRYLSQSNIEIVGITDPTQVLSLAKNSHPQAILLDVMMPSMDGWEILQKLKADPDTQRIAVIIFSVWDQPDLAFFLGANGFLKKPIKQVELMSELARLGLLDILDGSHPSNS